jgi:gas vesicle protein
MTEYFNFFGISLTWTIIIALLILAGFTYLFHKQSFLQTLLGLLRIIASIFYSPIIYFKKLFDSVNTFGQKGEKEYEESNQYLLNKFLIIIKGFWIIVGVLILASGIISSWNSFLPPEYLRNQISQYEDYIQKTDSSFESSKQKYEELESAWSQQSAQLINNYKSEIQKKISDAQREMTGIKNSYQNNEVFDAIARYISENENTDSDYYLEYYKNQSISYADNNEYDENIKLQLKKYVESWYLQKMESKNLANASDEYIRNQIQPEYANLKSEIDNYNNQKADLETELASLKKESSYNFESLLWGLIQTILTFIMFLWFMGLFTEMIFLVVDMAGNVKHIRGIADKNFPKINEDKKEDV